MAATSEPGEEPAAAALAAAGAALVSQAMDRVADPVPQRRPLEPAQQAAHVDPPAPQAAERAGAIAPADAPPDGDGLVAMPAPPEPQTAAQPAPDARHAPEPPRAPVMPAPAPARAELEPAPMPAAPATRTPGGRQGDPLVVSIEIGRIEIRTTPARAPAAPPRRITPARPHVIDPGLHLGGRRR